MKDHEDRMQSFKIHLIERSQEEIEWMKYNIHRYKNQVSRICPGNPINSKQNNINKFINWPLWDSSQNKYRENT